MKGLEIKLREITVSTKALVALLTCVHDLRQGVLSSNLLDEMVQLSDCVLMVNYIRTV